MLFVVYFVDGSPWQSFSDKSATQRVPEASIVVSVSCYYGSLNNEWLQGRQYRGILLTSISSCGSIRIMVFMFENGLYGWIALRSINANLVVVCVCSGRYNRGLPCSNGSAWENTWSEGAT